MDDETHALEPFLKKRLTDLGLDYDTYGPYVLPLLTENEDPDEDDWEGVMQLLQASSESHCDDDQAWKDLRVDIDATWKTHRDAVIASEREELEHNNQELKEILEKDRQKAAEAAILAEEVKKSKPADTTKVVDEAKRAMIARYAFEEEEEDEEEEEAPETNKQVAARTSKEKSAEEKNKHVVTKREEQQKTAAERMGKAKLKEERRERSTKQERKR